MINIFPLIIVIVILLILALSTLYLTSKIRLNKFAYWLLGGYTAVLIGFTIVYVLIPKEELIREDELSGEGIEAKIMDNVAYHNQSIEDFENYKVEEWLFTLNEDDKVGLYTESTEHHLPVLIEKESDAANIIAALYHVESGIALEPAYDEPNPVGIRFENSNLIISPPQPEYFRYGTVAKEFPFTQFSRTRESDHFAPRIYTGEYVFFLKVPEGLELIIDPDIHYEYID